MAKFKIRKGDRVVVITGSDKGKQGEVLRMIPDESRLVVQGVNIVTRHKRPSGMQQGGIERFEAPIHISNVAHIDPKDGKPTRIAIKQEGDAKQRIAKRSGVAIAVPQIAAK
jgi:large subunit ribosomal protein L24